MDNDQAAQAIDVAQTYIKRNGQLGLSVQVTSVEGNRTDSKKFLETSNFQFCVSNQATFLKVK